MELAPLLDDPGAVADHARSRMARLFRRIVLHAFAVVASLLLLMTYVADAGAQGLSSCERAARQWASSCAEVSALSLVPLQCASGFATFRVSGPDVSLDVEVRPTPKEAFRQAGNRGLSPIGEFADWSAAPEGLRAAFDAVAGCVEKGVPDAVFLSHSDDREKALADPSRPVPWRLVGAGIAIGFVIVAYVRRVRPRRMASTAAKLLALGVATWLFRQAFFPSGFFHQNAHGPMWVDCALGGRCAYGPGFREIFGLAAAADVAAAERGLFLLQSLLAATAPISAWILARSSGASRPVAWVVAFCVVIEPGLARLSQSESYFGTITWLLFAAAASLAAAARLGRSGSIVFAVAAIGAGLAIGQAAVVHPVAWIPAALIPGVVLFGRGAPRRRWRLFFAALLGTGIIAAASSLRIVLRVLDEHRRWSTSIGGTAVPALVGWGLKLLAVSAVLLGLWFFVSRRLNVGATRRLRRLMLPAVALVVVLVLGSELHPFDAQSTWIQHAAWSPYLPTLAAIVVAITAAVPRRASLWAASLLGVISIAHAASTWPLMTTLPTDVLEANLAFSWREALPDGARVIYLERVDRRIATFPVYRSSPRRIKLTRLRKTEGHDGRFELPAASGDFYYRSSVCSSEEGRPICQRLENQWKLEPVHLASLPAEPSMPYLPYDTTEVAIGLYRIVDVAKQEAASSTTP